MITVKNSSEIEKMRRSAAILTAAFKAVEETIEIGATTESMDKAAEETIRAQGGLPAFKGYSGFPAAICTSIDDQVVHGIPGERKLTEGEIVSVDIGVNLEGYFSDAAKTYAVGKISKEKQRLMDTTAAALHLGIDMCRAGNRLSDVSHAIQTRVEKNGYSVVRDLVGHGIGTALHEPPQIPNFGPPGQGPILKEGMAFAIEPMVNMGGHEIEFLDDGWTVVAADRSISAHFEHTIVITSGKPEILTIHIETQRE